MSCTKISPNSSAKLILSTNMDAPQIPSSQMSIILAELRHILAAQIPGDITEFGCYDGTASLKLAQTLQALRSSRELWLYDSFEGLPEKTTADQVANANPSAARQSATFRPGTLRASRNDLLRKFHRANLPAPLVKKAWFDELDPQRDLPAEIAFALLDGDYYDSIRVSLALVAPKLTSQAIIVVHDYENPALPGVQRAVAELLAAHPGQFHLTTRSGLAILTKCE